MQRTKQRTALGVLLALVASFMLAVVSAAPAQAAETADWLPFKVGNGVVEVGYTWDPNGGGLPNHTTTQKGIDFIVPVGTAVYAAGSGTVSAANGTCTTSCDGRGRYVEITHQDGRHSRYLHLSSVAKSSGGVNRGDLIGYSGDTMANGVPHLHYDESLNGSKVDPGSMKAVHGSALVEYPNDLGYSSWNNVPAWSDKFVHNDSFNAPTSGAGTRLVGDFNGDGLADAAVMFKDQGVAKVALSTGSSFGYPGDWSYGHSTGAHAYVTGDVNGDGKDDLIAYFFGSRTWNVSLSSGSGFWSPTEWGYDGSLVPDRTFFADANGDGKDDKIMFIGGTWYVSVSSGSGFWAPQAWISGHGAGSTDQQVGDFNGDGLADAGVWSGGNWHVALSTGSYFGYPGQWSAGHGVGSTFRRVGDFNGDGKDDIVYFSNSNVKWYVSASSGSGFWPEAEWAYDGSYNNMDDAFTEDVNGDGRADKVIWYRSSGNWYVGTSSGSGFWPLQLWISGHGAGS